MNNAIEHGEEWDAVLQIITTNGNGKWIRTKGKPEFEAGECVRIFGIIQDVDEQKRVEQFVENERRA